MPTMNVLITGGAGFIGSHLCDRLLAEGHRVVCVDNLLTGSPGNLDGARRQAAFRFLQHDITQPLAWTEPLDFVLHLASPASPVDYLKHPLETLAVGSAGTWNALELARAAGAKFLLASTSEVYGDPHVHPQPETYWGHVNPIGPRSCYDEAKRFAEALTMAFHRTHGVDTRIIRIFNSILADETVVLFNDHDIHLESIGDYVDSLESRLALQPPRIIVPTFDPISCRIALAEVSAVIKHPCRTECYALSLRYGKEVKVTGDHSVFTKDTDGRPKAIPVRQLRVGDYVAIPARLPVVEKDIDAFCLGEILLQRTPHKEWWNYLIQSPSLAPMIDQRREEIYRLLDLSGQFQAKRHRNGIGCAFRKYQKHSMLPLALFRRLNLEIPKNGRIRLNAGGAHIWLPTVIPLNADLLWLIGFFIAEGTSNFSPGKNAFLGFSSDERYLDRAARILTQLGCHVVKSRGNQRQAPAISSHSRLLYFLFDEIIGVIRQKDFPRWALQLPLEKLKYVLEGYREGDGTHSGKKLGNELCFDTTSERLATTLIYLLLRFGIVASLGRYTTTFRKKYGDRRFPFFRVTICAVDNFDVLTWDRGVHQTLNARRTGDLVWSRIEGIKPCRATGYVYDFSVPGTENFVAGNGVFCHNTYGPRMRLNDGRAVPTFIGQAMRGEPLTVFGDGTQTRSFCYVDDLVEGIRRVMACSSHDPMNLGNPDERSLLEIAQRIAATLPGAGRLEFRPLPVDDPKQRRPDISTAQRLLGWQPRVALDVGLERTIAWFRHPAKAA